MDEGAPGPPDGGSEYEVAGVSAESVVGPGAAPPARVEDLVGEVGGGEASSQARRPRVNRPVTCEEPDGKVMLKFLSKFIGTTSCWCPLFCCCCSPGDCLCISEAPAKAPVMRLIQSF